LKKLVDKLSVHFLSTIFDFKKILSQGVKNEFDLLAFENLRSCTSIEIVRASSKDFDPKTSQSIEEFSNQRGFSSCLAQ